MAKNPLAENDIAQSGAPSPSPSPTSSPAASPSRPEESAPAQELPFPEEVLADCERRSATSRPAGGAESESFAAPSVAQNGPDQVLCRLKRIGLSDEQAAAVMRSMFGGAFEATSFAAIADVIPADLPADVAVGLERILGRNDLIGVTFLEAGSRRARTVGRIVIKSAPTRQSGYGTGFLVWPGLLMTNNHVLTSAETAGFSRVQFNYEDDGRGVRQTPIEFELDPETFFFTSRELDFSLICVRDRSVDGNQSLAAFGWNRLRSDPGEILIGESVNIIQHPNGEPKQLALRENQVIGMPEDRFLHYQTDTAPGSSGSPVYNDQWELVALHHSGVPRRDGHGKILAVNGRIWTSAMGEHRIDWIANEGVRIAAIAAALRGAELAEVQRQMRDKALAGPLEDESTADRGTGSLAASNLRLGTAISAAAPPATSPPAATASGTQITLNIPLQLTLHLAPPTFVGGVFAGPVAMVTAAAPTGQSVAAASNDESAAGAEEGVSLDPDYSNRKGYIPAFLGKGPRLVRLPKLSPAQQKRAAVNQTATGGDKYVLPYHHYSVVMNKKRKLAFFTAVNIDGRKAAKVTREQDRWFYDPRIGRNEQSGAEIYRANPLDKGHLVRRLDAAWGDTEALARVGSDDTFHWTNCAPQHAEFNRNESTWAGLEDYILKNAVAEDLRVSVFSGPVFDDGDIPYRGINLPRQFWKVVVMVKKGGELSATGYLLSQSALIQDIEEAFAFGEYRTFQVPIRQIESLTGLEFHHLPEFDPLAGKSADALESAELHEVSGFEDLRL